MIFFNQKLSMRHDKKFYYYENNNQHTQKQNSVRKIQAIVEAIENISVSQNFIYDPLNVFSKPMGTVKVWIMKKISQGTKTTKKPIFFLKL